MPKCKGCGKFFIADEVTAKYCKNPCKKPPYPKNNIDRWLNKEKTIKTKTHPWA